MEFKHYSVLLEECIENLNIKPDGIYLDGTLGGGGHSFCIAQRLSDKGHLYGTDQDEDAIKAAGARLDEFSGRVTIIRDNYENAVDRLKGMGVTKVDGILLDLGVSSFQLDNAQRGFTYKEDVPLDMRMDRRQTLTARDIVNTYSETELFHIIRDYGEDKFAKNIAKHICFERNKVQIETTGQLNDVIK
ncbi:MAG: 16S rRNA (cytosine(1402)-N(4))-methyltransferase RsmH, partial [Lachnospiraceae bacterium]|nr:16S rRNA (cytosine(1402)-N(4))-methyltransferase RsmH [Lachnospiraceae bacterium]